MGESERSRAQKVSENGRERDPCKPESMRNHICAKMKIFTCSRDKHSVDG